MWAVTAREEGRGFSRFGEISCPRRRRIPVFQQLVNQPVKHLLPRLIGFGLFNQAALVALLFLPGTLRFWRGWAFIALNLVLGIFFCVYFYRHDRELLARRLLRGEKFKEQKAVMLLMKMVFVAGYLLCGLDNRFGWTQTHLIPVPWWLTALALLGYAGCYLLFIPVFTANRFAASVIQTEPGQTVADRGPYRFVRHPMYSVSLGLWFWIPLALGSLAALPVCGIVAPLIVWRLLHEEEVLRRDLPGYTEYCERVPWRLVPRVW